ncbi:MAG TPA: hypothetical protein VK841_19850 [Polyangiaceae bacterium]|jgi:hypothetical protein|nr:hypothetical protein [Polyangiaceae bacterium]
MAFRNTCELNVGKLLEIRVDAGYQAPADVDVMIGLIAQVLGSLPAHERIIIAADWRRCTVFGPGTADRALVMLTKGNPRLLRSGILIRPDLPATLLQVMRLVSDAQSPDRRVVTSTEAMISWLMPVTTPKELARLKVFLDR